MIPMTNRAVDIKWLLKYLEMSFTKTALREKKILEVTIKQTPLAFITRYHLSEYELYYRTEAIA